MATTMLSFLRQIQQFFRPGLLVELVCFVLPGHKENSDATIFLFLFIQKPRVDPILIWDV